jgi:hypothetical protein
MSVVVCNIVTQNDADFAWGFQWTLLDGVTPAVDLTGSMMEMKLRVNPEDVTALLELNTENGGITITNPTAAAFTLLITEEQLQVNLSPGEYVHSLIWIVGEQRYPLWNGTLTNTWGPSR